MNSDRNDRRPGESAQLLPWYRYPWPWVAIAIPAAAVVGGLLTLYLAISNPDPIVVGDQQYRSLRADLQAQPQDGPISSDAHGGQGREDGDD